MTATRTARRRPTTVTVAPGASAELEQVKSEARRQSIDEGKGAGRYSTHYTKTTTDPTTSEPIAETIIWANPLPPVGYDRRIEAAHWTGEAFTGTVGGNYARWVLNVRRATTSDFVAELRSDKTPWTAYRPVPFALNGKSPIVKPGEVVTLALEKHGPGAELWGQITSPGIVTIWVRDI